MKKLTFLLFAFAFFSCKHPKVYPDNSIMYQDPHSFAKPSHAVVKHLDLKINVNFSKKVISGVASWKIETKRGENQIVFDTKSLIIEKVTIGDDEKETHFLLGKEQHFLGRALYIDIADNTQRVNIYYHTTENSGALQWLEPAQTADKKHPFLFTQSQAILARTWIPCQDSPGIRFTYNATVTVPKDLLALMSAENPQEKNEEGKYSFKMEKAIPAYLMALSVGDIVYKSVGERTGVYAEPSVIEKAHYEFGEMQQMLESAEKLYGPYAWGRYDILVLPPSFPFGGMENPRLTFATPTVLAGDRSLASLVAHELAHSWSGNLVTNATWNDFWLNEGFTVYFERRIMEAIHGKDYAEMLTVLGYEDLQETLKEIGPTNEDTKLKLNLNGRNPDDGVSDIAYEKGFFLLKLIENKVGREKFDAFLNRYFEAHSFGSIVTEDFLAYLKKHLFEGNLDKYDSLKIDTWVYQPGLPDNCPRIVSQRFSAVEKADSEFIKGTDPAKLITKDWSSHEWLHFVRNLPEQLTMKQMEELDKTFHFTKTGNNEVLFAWLMLSVKNNYKVATPRLKEFLVTVGRRKFLTPLYKSLLKTKEGKEMALDIYKKARPNYHFVTVQTLDQLLNSKSL